MQIQNYIPTKRKKLTLLGIFLFLLSLILHYSGEWATYFIPHYGNVKLSNNRAIIKANLEKGIYYFSTGFLRGPCTLKVNNKEIYSNFDKQLNRHTSLQIGTILHIKESQYINAALECPEDILGVIWFNSVPIISDYFVGMTLHSWRVFLELYMGPVFSIILLIVLAINRKQMNIRSEWPYLYLAIVLVFYSISLSHLFKLYLTNKFAYPLHFTLRTLLSIGFFWIVLEQSKFRKLILYIHLLFIPALLISAPTRPLVNLVYRSEFVFFIGASMLALFEIKPNTKKEETFYFLCVLWFGIQIFGLLYLSGFVIKTITPSVLTIIMITLFRQKAEEYRELNQRVVISEQLSEAAARVAHDIRSPIMALETLRTNSSLEIEEKRILSHVVDRIKNISQSVLKPEYSIAPKLLLSHEIHRIIEEVYKEKQLTSLHNKAVVFSTKLNEGNSKKVKASTQIREILSNLINNSIEAISDKGTISTETSVDNEYFYIIISDNGPGIPADILPKLMKKGATFGKRNGNGLGLYLAKKQIEAWGGDLKLSSTINIGTTITIQLLITEST